MSTHVESSSRLATQMMGQPDNHPVFDQLLNAWTDREIRLVLFGRTGEGKSATGNVLLGAKLFKTSSAMRSETQECQTGKREFEGRHLLVIDTPGLFDTAKDPLSVAYEISKAVGISAPGPHAFIIVIKAGGGRYTREAEETVKLLHDIFGGDITRYCIVVFTGEDNMRQDDPTTTLDRWLAKATGSTISLIEACDNRCMAIDTTDRSKETHDTKVRELISMVDQMIDKNGGRVYTNEMLERAEQAYREREQEMLRAQHEKEKRHQQEIDQNQDALLAMRLQCEEREKHLQEQGVTLMASRREQEQNNQKALGEARDNNRETVKKETGGIWESLCKHALPTIIESISTMFADKGGDSPGGAGNGSRASNNHQLGGLLRQATGRQEQRNSANPLFHRHIGNTGLFAPDQSSSFHHHHIAHSRPGGFCGSSRPAHHHRH